MKSGIPKEFHEVLSQDPVSAMKNLVENYNNPLKKEEFMDASKEMPKYKSHKEVWGLKIAKIEKDSDLAKETNRETDGSAIITPVEDGYAPFGVDHAYMHKHKPYVGGYYVVYEGGYKSFSPADAFEDGYTKI